VGFGLSNNVLPFFPICHQLSPSSHSQHLKISFYFLFPPFPGSSPSSRTFQFFSEDHFGHPILTSLSFGLVSILLYSNESRTRRDEHVTCPKTSNWGSDTQTFTTNHNPKGKFKTSLCITRECMGGKNVKLQAFLTSHWMEASTMFHEPATWLLRKCPSVLTVEKAEWAAHGVGMLWK